jgi:gliding motility-associated protein GldL
MAKKVGGFKKIIAMAYGLGAAVVILGALFKIMHWPGADEMLIAGMGTEVLIFLISAFEPTYEDYQWERVYPHLMKIPLK